MLEFRRFAGTWPSHRPRRPVQRQDAVRRQDPVQPQEGVAQTQGDEGSVVVLLEVVDQGRAVVALVEPPMPGVPHLDKRKVPSSRQANLSQRQQRQLQQKQPPPKLDPKDLAAAVFLVASRRAEAIE